MNTTIITAHEESYFNDKTLGVLLSLNENGERVDSLVYIYHQEMYVFFNTIIEMMDYLLYGDKKIKRAYIKESDFDKFYDMDMIPGLFSEQLTWLGENPPNLM